MRLFLQRVRTLPRRKGAGASDALAPLPATFDKLSAFTLLRLLAARSLRSLRSGSELKSSGLRKSRAKSRRWQKVALFPTMSSSRSAAGAGSLL